jgi:hypothetical protein
VATATLAATLNTPISQLRPALMERILVTEDDGALRKILRLWLMRSCCQKFGCLKVRSPLSRFIVFLLNPSASVVAGHRSLWPAAICWIHFHGQAQPGHSGATAIPQTTDGDGTRVVGSG